MDSVRKSSTYYFENHSRISFIKCSKIQKFLQWFHLNFFQRSFKNTMPVTKNIIKKKKLSRNYPPYESKKSSFSCDAKGKIVYLREQNIFFSFFVNSHLSEISVGIFAEVHRGVLEAIELRIIIITKIYTHRFFLFLHIF